MIWYFIFYKFYNIKFRTYYRSSICLTGLLDWKSEQIESCFLITWQDTLCVFFTRLPFSFERKKARPHDTCKIPSTDPPLWQLRLVTLGKRITGNGDGSTKERKQGQGIETMEVYSYRNPVKNEKNIEFSIWRNRGISLGCGCWSLI